MRFFGEPPNSHVACHDPCGRARSNCSWLERVDDIMIEMHPSTVDVECVVKTLESAGLDLVAAGSVWSASVDAGVR